MQEKTLHSERIYDGKLVVLDRLEVELPDGNIAERELIRHPGAVAIVPIDADKHVLMVRQYRVAAGKVMLEIPAGTLEPDEEPEKSALRELQEEVQHTAHRLDYLGGIYAAPGYTTEFIHLYVGRDLVKSSLQQDEDEFIEVVRIPFTEALAKVDAGEIIDGKTVAGLLRAARFLEG